MGLEPTALCLLHRQSTLPTELPTELPGQLSRQDIISLQHNTTQGKVKPQITLCMVTQKKPYTNTLHIIVIDITLFGVC